MAAPTYVASGGIVKSVSGASVDCPVPAGHATNDIFLLEVTGDRAGSLTTPTGWTQVSASPQTNTADATNITDHKPYLYWRRASSGSETSTTLNTSALDAGGYTVARMHAFRGCLTSADPINAAAGSTTNSSADPGICADLTTTTPSTMVVIFAAHGVDTTSPNFNTANCVFDGATSAPWVDFTAQPFKINDGSTNDGDGGGQASWYAQVEPVTTITGSQLDMTTASYFTSITVALTPQSAAISGSDSGTGTDTSRIGISNSDTGSGTDTGSLAVAVPQQDTGSGTETQRIGINQSDTGSDTETGSIAVAVSSSDTGTDTETAKVSLTSSDTGSGTDTSSLAVALSSSDTSMGTDSQSVDTSGGIPKSSSDTGTGTDNQSINVAISQSDTGSGTEAWDVFTSGELLPPTNLQVNLVYLNPEEISYSELAISWDSVDGADFYQLERDSVIIAYGLVGTSYTDSGLTYGVQYTYRVRAARHIT